jgi:hypothetical protein
MPHKETFAEAAARIANEPVVVTIPVKKIEIDLSLPGILSRVKFLAEEAHKTGNLVDDRFNEIVGAADKLKNAVSQFNPKQLLKNLPGFGGKK